MFSVGIVLIASASQAQLLVGVRGGHNINSFRGDDAFDAVPGFNAGGVFRYQPLSFLTARLELLYVQQGANIIDYTAIYPYLDRSRVRVAFHNAAVPVLVELGLPSLLERGFQPKLIVGGFYSYTVYARETYNNVIHVNGYEPMAYEGATDFTPFINRHQYGFIGAVAADVRFGETPVSIEVRYQYNYNQVNKAQTSLLPSMHRTHNQWGDKLYLATLSISLTATLFNL